MSPWCFKIDGQGEGFPTLEVLARRIADSELFICIIGADYGSELGHQPISFTEWEILTAIYYQKEIKLYVEECGSLREARLSSLLAILNDELVGYFNARFESLEDLCFKIERDVLSWAASRSLKAIQIGSALDNVLDLPDVGPIRDLESRADPIIWPAKTSSPLQSEMQRLDTLKNRGMYGKAHTNALAMFSAKRDNGNYFREDCDLPTWATFLSLFANILAVQDRIRCGNISAVAIAKAEFKARQLLGDKAGMVRAASAVSGILNMAGLFHQALAWNNFALERSQFVASFHAILDTRSSILRNQQRFAQAGQSLQAAINTFDGGADELGYMLSRLAGIQFSLGNRTRALKTLDQAAKHLKPEGLGMSIYVRELMTILIANHEMKEAEKQLQVGLAICGRLGLERPRRALVKIAFTNGIQIS